MLKTTELRILTALAALGLILALTNMVLFAQNRTAQAEISTRAQFIQQSVQLEPLYREIIKALADLSVRNNDGQLRDLLAKQGITVSTNPAPSPQMAPSGDPKKGGK